MRRQETISSSPSQLRAIARVEVGEAASASLGYSLKQPPVFLSLASQKKKKKIIIIIFLFSYFVLSCFLYFVSPKVRTQPTLRANGTSRTRWRRRRAPRAHVRRVSHRVLSSLNRSCTRAGPVTCAFATVRFVPSVRSVGCARATGSTPMLTPL